MTNSSPLVPRWLKTIWRLYKAVGRVFLSLPGSRSLLGRSTLVRSIAALPLRFLVARLSNPIVTGDEFRLTLYLPRRAYHFSIEALTGIYERETLALLKQILRPGMTVVDLGAHVGYISLVAASHVGPTGKVYAFEPQPDVRKLLAKNIAANGWESVVRLIPKAVGNRNGTMSLFLAEWDSVESSFYRRSEVNPTEQVSVETITLDSFFEIEGWPSVQLVKMDIEGAERLALEGMREFISRNPGLRLIIEFSPGVLSATGATPDELFRVLRDAGFSRSSLISDSLAPLIIPDDIPQLINAAAAGDGYVNLLCDQ